MWVYQITAVVAVSMRNDSTIQLYIKLARASNKLDVCVFVVEI